jgi:exopolyphosphatase / guanosine-5'-triphosphate,3'-diphosphate pyrophosphatase
MKLFSSVYIGSYEVTMKLYELRQGRMPQNIDTMRMPMPIVYEISKTKSVSIETTEKLVSVISDMKKVMDSYSADIRSVYAGATLHRAENELFVLEQIRLGTGISVHVLRNSEQRFLEYISVAAMSSFEDYIKNRCVMADVGGSSLQLTLFSEGKVSVTQHLPLGTFQLRDTYARLSEMPDHREQMSDMIDKEFDVFQKMYLHENNPDTIIILEDQLLPPIDEMRGSKNDLVVETDRLKKKLKNISINDDSSIGEMFHSSPELSVEPVLLLHRELLKLIPSDTTVIPGAIINDGICLNYCYENGIIKKHHDFHEDIINASWAIADRYDSYRPHLRTLRIISLKIFDIMKKYHGMGKRQRLLMEVATILHDCGKYISIYESAECSHRIILSSEILGLTHKEREIVAAVAKYNRTEMPMFRDLRDQFSEEEYFVIVKLLAILKVSNALDRSHKQKLKNISMRIRNNELIIGVEANDSITLEKGMFEKQADFFYRTFAIRPVIREKNV